MYTRDTFNVRARIQGATRNSVILKGDDGEAIYCNNKVFNRILQDPDIRFEIEIVPAHSNCMGRQYPETKWIAAYIKTRSAHLIV
jgi:adenylyl- and sulfurtransferase ThiI